MNRKLSLLILLSCSIFFAYAQDTSKVRALEIYGFAMTDMGYNFNQINPNWSDALRITKLPSYKDQYAPDGQVFFGVRQTRFGVKGYTPTALGELTAVFEFDMWGVGADEGKTTIRPRHFYGELGRVLVGQTNSPFMDGDVWPNTAEYWGPSGMVFYRNIQIRYAPLKGDNEVFIALERPGTSADKGVLEYPESLDSVKAQLQLPDLSAHYKRSGNWGHVQIAGMLRQLKWKDLSTNGTVNGHVTGWGLNLSTVLNISKADIFRGSFVYGEGVENYMQDAPVDVGTTISSSGAIGGKALPVYGILAFLDHYWTPKWCTAIGYSSVHITNTDLGSPDAYKNGQYVIVNISVTPVKNFWAVAELQWGKRDNFSDGFSSNATKIQFSFKYNFSQVFYGNKN
ncbi:MAG TPA: DcaP family trimeric outer membrane transporter [Puia sp.]|nr:DcaP family trimeric outer membrane transporter [Puia sp.]